MLKAYISKPLEIVFNASISTGVVPSDFKIANVVPVFKKGSQSSLCNYRPISLISVFSKLLEKLVYYRLIKFLEKTKFYLKTNMVSELSTVLTIQFFA